MVVVDVLYLLKSAMRVRYFVTQLSVRKEFAGSSVSEIEAAIETLVEKEKAFRDKKVGDTLLRPFCLLLPLSLLSLSFMVVS